MNSIDGLKTCRKGLHQYKADQGRCLQCKKESEKRWYQKNTDLKREKSRVWREQNPEQHRENCRQCHEKNRELYRERKRKRRQQNPEIILERNRQWRRNNPDKARAQAATRKARKKQATPPWADRDEINAVYALAVKLEQETGIPHHVDHIYPLSSPYLCGLHVAENLQVLTGSENCSKGNRTWPGQLDCQKSSKPKFLKIN